MPDTQHQSISVINIRLIGDPTQCDHPDRSGCDITRDRIGRSTVRHIMMRET